MAARVILWICAVTFVGLGIALLLRPAEILAAVELTFETPTAFADVRADYGGCILGIGCFLVWCALQPARIRTGLLCTGLVMSGYVIGRVYSLFVDGMPKPIIFILITVELAGAVVCFGLINFAPSGNENSEVQTQPRKDQESDDSETEQASDQIPLDV